MTACEIEMWKTNPRLACISSPVCSPLASNSFIRKFLVGECVNNTSLLTGKKYANSLPRGDSCANVSLGHVDFAFGTDWIPVDFLILRKHNLSSEISVSAPFWREMNTHNYSEETSSFFFDNVMYWGHWSNEMKCVRCMGQLCVQRKKENFM